MTQSKVKKSDGGVLDHTAIIDKLFRVHARSVHYSLRKKMFDEVLTKAQGYHISIVREAYDIWYEKGREAHLAYHPNYFLAVCKGLESKRPDKYIKAIWGKEL